MARDVTELKVYQEALRLLPELYEVLKEVPDTEKDSVWQLKRAAKSIPANIAEGFAKSSSIKEFKRYLLIALGSSDEVISHLRVLDVIFPNLQINKLLYGYTVLSKR